MKISRFLVLLISLSVFSSLAADETRYKPFVLASVSEASLADQFETTVAALEAGGFTVAGHYRPLENTVVIVATSDALKEIAAQSDRGGYAAGQRISLTERENGTEIAYVNPLYIQYAYRLEADMSPVYSAFQVALGNMETFGSKKGLKAKKLRKYNYMPMMQKFDDPSELGEFSSFEEATAAVEAGLATEGDALTQIYRIDIPGKDQAVFGVGMKATGNDEDEEDIDEAFQMSIVDFEGPSKVAYFPYEILVNGKNVEALHMRFRMAVHFPDLSMMGEHGFTKLMSSPGAIENALETLIATP